MGLLSVPRAKVGRMFQSHSESSLLTSGANLVSFADGFVEGDLLSSSDVSKAKRAYSKPESHHLQTLDQLGNTSSIVEPVHANKRNMANTGRPKSILRLDTLNSGGMSGSVPEPGASAVSSRRTLHRVLPDKLDWTHSAFTRLWLKPDHYPYGGISSHQLLALSKKSAEFSLQAPGSPAAPGSPGSPSRKSDNFITAENDSLARNTSVPVLAAIHAAGFEPSLTMSSRSRCTSHAILDAGATAFNPRPPSSLAIPTRAMNRPLPVMKDKRAFVGKNC